MISYAPLWETMERKRATTYTLRKKGKYMIGSGSVKRLRENQSVSTNTLNALCNILGCTIKDIIEFIPD